MSCYKLIAFIIYIIISLSFSNHTLAQEINWKDSNLKVLTQHILPRYKQLNIASEQMRLSLENAKETCSDFKDIYQWRIHFKTLFQDWASIQHIRMGPITFLERYERLHFWPDKHNRANRQLQQLLNNYDDTLTVETFQKKSVALQGLGALEKLLFSSWDTTNISQQTLCDLMLLIANNIVQITQSTEDSWIKPPLKFADEFNSAGQTAAYFMTDAEIAQQLFVGMRTQLAIVEELKLKRVFIELKKINEVRINPKRLEAWRSRHSLDLIKENIYAIKELYTLGFSSHLNKQQPKLHTQIMQSFHDVEKILKSFNISLYDLLNDNKNKEQLNLFKSLIQEVQVLNQRISNELPQQLGLGVSFNALDGD